MKKLMICGFYMASAIAGFAQTKFNVSKFDLQSVDAHKSYFFYPGKIDDNGNYIVKMGKPTCDVSKSSSTNYTTGTTTTTTRFNDIDWNFMELKFDKEFNYIDKNTKKFKNSLEALNYAPVYNKIISPIGDKLISAALPPSYITQDYLNHITVHPTISLGGTKISSFSFGNRTIGNETGCSDVVVAYKENTISPKEEKGQKWYAITSAHYPGGGDVLFSTVGVHPDNGESHLVFNRYNDALEVINSTHIPVKFNPAIRMLEIKNDRKKNDYLLVIQPASKYGKNSVVKPADHVEFIYIDGETLGVKFRTETQLTYSQWFANIVVKTDDGIIITGPASKDNKTSIEIPGHAQFFDNPAGAKLINSPKKLPNYQLVKLNTSSQKVEWVNGISSTSAQSKVEVLNGTTIKVKPTPIFTIPETVFINKGTASEITHYVNGKLIITAQQLLGFSSAEDRGSMFTMIFDSKGNLEKYFIKPETTFAQHEIFFSTDKKTMHWVNYEVGSLNEVKNENGSGGLSKKVPSMFAANLHLVKINLTNNSSEGIEIIGDGTWALNANNPVVVQNEKEIIFLGREVSKKAKNSELVFIRVEK